MKATCKRESLLASFQTAASVAPTRSPKPILQNVKMEAATERALLLATDLEQGIRLEVADVETTSPGTVVLPVQRFGSILRESDDSELYLESDGQGTVIRGQRSEFRLPATDPEEFPDIPVFAEENYYETSARLLREMIRRTVFAVDTDSGRYALGGVLLEWAEASIVMVATDGRRLAKMEGPASRFGNPAAEDAIIIPARALNLLERALSDDDAEVQIAGHANEILVKGPRAVVHTRLLEGRFPRWRDVFPERGDAVHIDIPVGPFYSAVRQAAIVTSEDSRGVDFQFGSGKLVLAGRSAEVGQARIELPIAHEGKEVSVMLDPRFLTDYLKVLDSESTFKMAIMDAESAAVCSTEDGYAYVIMPLSPDRAKA